MPVASRLCRAAALWLLLASGTGFATPCPAASPDANKALIADVERARAQRRKDVPSVTADVVIGLSSPSWQGAGTCQGRLVAQRPGSLRLQGYAAVLTVFDAGTDGTRFWLYIPALDRAIEGAAGEESLLVELPVLPGEIVAALFGEPYGAPEGGLRSGTMDGKPAVAWDLPDGHEVRARYRQGPTLIERAELWRGDTREARLTYHDYRKRKGVWWPTRIDFDWPATESHLSLTFDTVEFGATIPAQTFRFTAPEGVTVLSPQEAAP